MFKEGEKNKNCCSCTPGSGAGSPGVSSESGINVTGINRADIDTRGDSFIADTGKEIIRVDKERKLDLYKNPQPISAPQLTDNFDNTFGNNQVYNQYQNSLNLHLARQ
jgi:hypothetical protein